MDHKYEEALERAKQGLPIDEVFPELKESEDERIRKFIMACINELRKANAENAEFNGECSDALAYLEKQKEQKPVISDEAIRDGVAHFGITQYQINNWLKKHINIVKQQPAEWSKEDEFFRQQLIIYCENCVQDTLAAKCVDWLKSLRPQPHWKPSEYTLSLVKKVANGEMLTHMEQMAMETLCNDLQKLH